MTKNWISIRQKWQSKIAQEEELIKNDFDSEEDESFLEKIGKPFDWYKRNVEEPWAAVITAPFSPELPRQPFEGWMESEQRQYREWEAPRFVKGAAELSTPVNWLPFAGLGGKALRGVGLLPKAGKIIPKAEAIPAPEVTKLTITKPVLSPSQIQDVASSSFRKMRASVGQGGRVPLSNIEVEALRQFINTNGDLANKNLGIAEKIWTGDTEIVIGVFNQEVEKITGGKYLVYDVKHNTFGTHSTEPTTKAILGAEKFQSGVKDWLAGKSNLGVEPLALPKAEIPKGGKIIPKVGKVTPAPEVTGLPSVFIKATERDILGMEEQVARQRLVVEKARNIIEQVVPPEAKVQMPRTGQEKLETLVDIDSVTPEMVKAVQNLRDELRTLVNLEGAVAGIKKFLAEAKAYKAPAISKVEGGMPEIVDPDVADLFNVLKQAKVARKVTKQARKIEQGERIKKAASIFEETYKKTGNINEARMAESRALRGEYPTDVSQISEFLKPQTIESLRKKIADIPELSFWDSKRADLALVEFLENPEYLLQPNQIKTLDKIFKGGFEQLNVLKASLGSSGWTRFMDIAGIPRAVLASGDNSFPLRQGAILLARRPYLLPAVLAKSFKAIFNPKYSQQVDDVIRADPDFALFEGLLGKTKGYVAPQPGKIALTAKEEMFQSNIAENLPVIGKLVRASERGFVTGANYLRFKSFKKGLELGRKLGLSSENDLDELRRFVNIASGRGEIPKAFTSSSPLMNALFFSPRLIMSRLQLPTTLFSSSKLVRRESWQTFIQFMGFGVGFLTLAKLAGAEIGTDSKSSDFGKMKINNTRLDVWSGYAQWARFVSQLTTAERTTIGGEKQELNRLDVVYRFMQSKGSPFASLMIDLLAGQNYIGQEMFEGGTETMKREAIARLVPLFAQDMLDAIKADGLSGGITALPGGLGVGVTSYQPKPIAPPRIGESKRRLRGIKKGLSRRRLSGVK